MGTEVLRAQINEAGGLHTFAGLARRWGISRERVRQLAARADFPAPVLCIDGRGYYDGRSADAWFASRRGAHGRLLHRGDS